MSSRNTYSSAPPSALLIQSPGAGQAPAANTAAVFTYTTPVDGTAFDIGLIEWAYSAAPTNGSLTVSWGAYSKTYYITAAGPGQLNYLPALRLPINTTLTVTLAAGGAGIYGSIYVEGFVE